MHLKRIFFLLLFCISTLSTFAQDEKYLNSLIERGFMTEEEVKNAFPNVKRAQERGDCVSLLDSVKADRLYEGQLKRVRETFYEYDEMNRITFLQNRRRINNELPIQNEYVSEFVYDNLYRTSWSTKYSLENGEVNSILRYETLLNNDANFIETTTFVYSELTDSYEQSGSVLWEYYASGFIKSITRFIYENFESIPKRIVYYHRDLEDVNKLDSITTYTYSAELEQLNFLSSETFNYDEELRLKEATFSTLVNNLWSIGELPVRKLVALDSFFYNFTNDNYERYHYTNYTPIDTLELTNVTKVEVPTGLTSVDTIYRLNSENGMLNLSGYREYAYNEYGNLVEVLYKDLDENENSILWYEERFYYSECNQVIHLEEKANCEIPNPVQSNEFIICTLLGRKEGTINFYDLLGRRVHSQKILSAERVNLRHLPITGLYIMTIEDDSGVLWQRKTVVIDQ